MARRNLDEILYALTAYKGEGVIWNVDYKDLADSANRGLYREVQEAFVWQDYEKMDEAQRNVYLGPLAHVPSSVLHLSGWLRKTAKYSGKWDWLESRRNIAVRWHPVGELLKECKPLIKKGRRPALNPAPEKDPAEHECQYCGRDVRGSASRVARHGFQRPWRMGVTLGGCPGEAHPSYKISRDLIGEIIPSLTQQAADVEAELERIKITPPKAITITNRKGDKVTIDRDHEDYDRQLRIFIAERESTVRMIRNEVARLQHRWDHWKPPA